ncbi:MAG: H/ACA ribonucleoprotein complex subunit GAR1 [Candidatus Methanospirareceae archaeon]
MKRNKKELKKLGIALHLYGNKLIVRGRELKVEKIINKRVMMKDKKEIGRIYDIFGPIKHPYICVRVSEDVREEALKNLLNKAVYIKK